MMRIVEHDFSEVVKNSEDKVERIGEIDGVGLYYNKYQEENEFLVGYKEQKINFIVGNCNDLEKFKKVLEAYKNNKYQWENIR
jgi:hypothetical protein